MSLIYLICACSTFFGTKEIKDVIEDANKDFFAPIKLIFKHKSYLTLLFAFLFSSLSIQVNKHLFLIY